MNHQRETLTRNGSKHAQPEVRKIQIIEAAMICFGRWGYASTTIDSIGKQASLSKGTIYRFFSSKDELLLAVVDYVQSEFEARFEERISGKTCIQQLEVFFRLSVEEIIRQRELPDFWVQILNLNFAKEKVVAVYKRDLAMLTSILIRGIEQGQFSESVLKSVPTAIIALTNGHFLLAHIFQESDEEWLEKVELSWELIKLQLLKK